MEELIAFLRARLDEDEAAAKLALWSTDDTCAQWTAGSRAEDQRGPTWYVVDGYDEGVVSTVRPQAADDKAIAEHIARYDPARALAEVKIWRRLLLESQLKGLDTVYAGTERETGFHLALGLALKSKAMVYSDHPDYREELLAAR